MAERWQDDWLSSGFVKMFMDGVIDSRTAFMLNDYPGQPGYRSHGRFSADRFAALATRINAMGLGIAVHAIGDAANRRCVDLYERLLAEHPRADRHHERAMLVGYPIPRGDAVLVAERHHDRVGAVEADHLTDDRQLAAVGLDLSAIGCRRGEGRAGFVVLEAGGWEVIKKYVEMGLGISIVTDVCLTGEEKLVKFPLDEYFPKRTYGIVLRRGKYLSPQAKRFIETMEDCY